MSPVSTGVYTVVILALSVRKLVVDVIPPCNILFYNITKLLYLQALIDRPNYIHALKNHLLKILSSAYIKNGDNRYTSFLLN